MDIIKPITIKLAPREVNPPIFNANACIIKLINATILEECGPNIIAINGIKKKWIGTPRGEGIDSDVMITVNTLKIAIETIFLSFWLSFWNL